MQSITAPFKIRFNNRPVLVYTNGNWLKIQDKDGFERYYKMKSLGALFYWRQRNKNFFASAVFFLIVFIASLLYDVSKLPQVISYLTIGLFVSWFICITMWYASDTTEISLLFGSSEKVILYGKTTEITRLWGYLESSYGLQ
jgi:hypothetical protein